MKSKPKECKFCHKKFTPFNSLDKFCSFSCAKNAQTFKTTKQKQRDRAKLKPQSSKLKAEARIYRMKRKVFLKMPENKHCPVAKAIFDQAKLSTEIHHKAGRRGKLLNYTPFWLAVSRKGHNWIHSNPKEAYKLGFMIKYSTVKIQDLD